MNLWLRFGLWLLLVAGLAPPLRAQVDVNCNTLTYTQNFNALQSAPNTCANGNNIGWADNGALPGWYIFTPTSQTLRINASNGSCASGGVYSYGLTADVDRALGEMSSGSNVSVIGVRFTNNTGKTIRSLDVRYFGEVWARGSGTQPDGRPNEKGLTFEYSTTATTIDGSTGTWTRVTALDFAPPATLPAHPDPNDNGAPPLAINGNLAAHRAERASSIAIDIPPGGSVLFRWNASNDSGTDCGVAVDDFSVGFNLDPIDALAGVMGSALICSGSTENYTARPSQAGVTYSWTIEPPVAGFTNGSAGNPRSVNWGAAPQGSYTITVTPSDGCQTGTPFVKNVTVSATPTVNISELPARVQVGDEETFKVNASPGDVVVTWNGPAGLNLPSTGNPISVNFGDAVPAGAYLIEVNGQNGCGLGVPQMFTLDITPAPPTNPDGCEFTWSRFVGSGGIDNIYSTATDGDGNVYITGSFVQNFTLGAFPLTTAGGDDVILAKFDPNGNVLWARTAGGPGADLAKKVTVDNNFNPIIAGAFVGTAAFGATNLVSAGDADMFVAKYDRDGNLLWAKRGGGPGEDLANSVAVNADGSIVHVVGQYADGSDFDGNAAPILGSGLNAFVAYFDAAGNYMTHNRAGGDDGDASARDVSIGPLGDVYVVGDFSGTMQLDFTAPPFPNLTATGDNKVFIASYAPNATAALRWAVLCGGEGLDYGFGVDAGPTNDVYITGTASSESLQFGAINLANSPSSNMIYVARLTDNDDDATFDWARLAGSPEGIDFGMDLVVDDDNDVLYVSGFFSATAQFSPTVSATSPAGVTSGFVAKYTIQTGSALWVMPYGVTGQNNGAGVTLDGNGRIFVAGTIGNANFACREYTTAGSSDGFVAAIQCPVTPVTASFNKTDVTTPGGTQGSITAAGNGGGGSVHEYKLGAGSFQSSGSFTGLTAGDYVLTVRGLNYCTQDLNISIVENLPCTAPTNLTSGNLQGNSVDLRWTTTANATAYRVTYTKTATNETNSATVDAASLNFPYTLSPLDSETNYSITVTAICGANESPASLPVQITTPAGCDAPDVQLLATSFTTGSVEWDAVAGDIRYEGEIKLLTDATWGGAFTTTDTTREFTGLQVDETYQVRVRRVCADNSVSAYAVFDFATSACEPPPGLTTSFTSTGIRVRWNSVAGAPGYEVEYRVQPATAWSAPIAVTDNETIINGAQAGQTYDIRVRTVCVASTELSAFDTTNVTVPACAVPVVTPTPEAGGLRVGWPPVFGAVYYELQFKFLNTTLWSGIITQTDTSRLFTGLVADSTYQFRVRAVCVPNVEVSAFGTANFTLPSCTVPTGLTVCGLNPVRVRWTAVPNAEGYQISYRPVNKLTWTVAQVTQPTAALAGSFNQTPYVVRVRTVCAGGAVSAYTAEVTSTDCPTQCPTPTNLALNDFLLTGNQAEVTWDPVSGAVSYEVRFRREATGNWVSFYTYDQNYLITGLSPNVRYEVQVRSICPDNELSAFTGSLQFRTPTGSCVTPEDFRVLSTTDTTITLTWTPQPNVLNYEIRWQAVGDLVWQASTVSASPFTITNLSSDVNYLISLRSLCAQQDVSTFTPPIEVTPQGNCPAPTGLQAAVPSKSEAVLSWTAVEGAQGYILQYRLLGEADWTSFIVPTNEGSLQLLAADTTYEYSVVTICGTSSRSPQSVIDSFDTFGPCPTPVNLNFTQITPTTAVVNWTQPDGLPTYELEYRRASVATWTTVPPVNGNAFTLTDLSSETKYVVRVRTVCIEGRLHSPYAVDSFTTSVVGCSVPANVNATREDETTWAIAWTGAADAISYELEYRLLPDGAFIQRVITGEPRDTLRELNGFANYEVRVRAICVDDRQSDFSPLLTLQGLPCSSPGPVLVIDRTQTTARLEWVPVLESDGYELQVLNLQNQSLATFPINDPSINVFDVTGLAAGTGYSATVVVLPASNCPTASVEFTTLGENNETCAATASLTLTQLAPTEIEARWTPVPGVQRYELSYRPVTRATWTTISSVPGPTFVMRSLLVNTKYIVRLRSVCTNPAGFSEYVIDSIPKAQPCPAPANLAVSGITTTQADITWSTVANVPTYQVQYRASNAVNWTVLAPVASPPVRIEGLTPNTQYQVRVRSMCEGDNVDPFSSFIVTQFTTEPVSSCPTPTEVQTSPLSLSSVLVQWTASATATAYELEFRVQNSANVILRMVVGETRDTLTGLSANTVYEVRVRAICVDDEVSAYSAPRSFTTGTPCPSVSAFQVTPGQTTATLNWTPAAGAIGYTIEWRALNSATVNTLTVNSGSTSSAAFGSLTPDTPYQVRIRTRCAADNSAFGDWVDFRTTAAPVCQQPATFALEPQATSVLVSWTTVPGATGYEIEYRVLNAPAWTTLPVAGGNTNSARIIGLTPETSYEIRFRTICTFGSSAFMEPELFVTERIDPTSCPAPLNVQVTPSLDRATITWLPAFNATGYELEWKEISELDFQVLPISGPTNTTVVLQPLEPNRTYVIQVLTRCPNGLSRPSAQVQFVTRPGACPTPTNVSVLAQATSASVSWAQQSGVIGYEIEWRNVNDAFTTTETINDPNQTNFTLQGLTSGQTYELTVISVCLDGFSEPSTAVRFTTAAPPACGPATNLQATPRGTFADLTWSIPSNATGSILRWRATQSTRPPVQVNINQPTTSFRMSGLLPNTEYEFIISIRCGTTVSGPTSVVFRTLAAREDAAAGVASVAMSVYPNPNRGQFTLRLDGCAGLSVPLKLVDLTGRSVWHTTVHPQGDGAEFEVAPESLSPGVYLLRVGAAAGEETVKVVVQ